MATGPCKDLDLAIDPAQFRRVLGHYPTGVCVITATHPDGDPVGMVVGTFTSVSLDPPLVGFFPDRRSASWARIAAAKRFCVNVLAHDQGDLCRRFAARGDAKFAGVAYRRSAGGAPILPDVVAWIDCELHGVHPAGDHEFVMGEVVALDVERGCSPLLFFQGAFGDGASLCSAGPAANN